MLEKVITQEPMEFVGLNEKGIKVISKGMGYILWERVGRDLQRISSTKFCENQDEADEWAEAKCEIFECPLPPRLQEIHDAKKAKDRARHRAYNARKRQERLAQC